MEWHNDNPMNRSTCIS